MATEKNKFDDYLKDKLLRDLLFRGVIVIFISLLASYYALHFDKIAPLKLMLGVAEKIMDGLDSIGIVALLLACSALMFKELEICDSNNWGQHTRKGGIGCIARRLAGDLTLWALGLVLTLFISTLIFIAISNAVLSVPQIIALTLILVIILAWLFFVAFLNMLVRQNQTKRLLPKLKTPTQIISAFSTPIFICIVILVS